MTIRPSSSSWMFTSVPSCRLVIRLLCKRVDMRLDQDHCLFIVSFLRLSHVTAPWTRRRWQPSGDRSPCTHPLSPAAFYRRCWLSGGESRSDNQWPFVLFVADSESTRAVSSYLSSYLNYLPLLPNELLIPQKPPRSTFNSPFSPISCRRGRSQWTKASV